MGSKKVVENSPENCQFTGYIEDVRGAFAAGDIFFFPTKNENEGMALLEAMACGKPPVARDIDTFNWLEDGKNCLKAENNFQNLISELKNEEKYRELANNAEKKSQEFRLENIGEKLESTYEKILN